MANKLLTAQPLDDRARATLAQRGGWQMVRMNLSSFRRHGVFELPGMTNPLSPDLFIRGKPIGILFSLRSPRLRG